MKRKLIGVLGLGISVISFCSVLTSCNKSSDPNAQLNKELTAIQEYITANSTTYSDVFYNQIASIGVTSMGSGVVSSTGRKVFVYYTLSLLSDGTVLRTDSLQDVVLDNITIPGLAPALTILPAGSHAQIFVPSPSAYGTAGEATLGVPPNATIVYNVYVKRVTLTSDQAAQLSTDSQLIQHYLDSLSIQAIHLANGVWMSYSGSGTGSQPSLYDNVTFHYKGTILSNGTEFQESDLTSTPIVTLIEGFQYALPFMRDGGTATFYIPSVFAYGKNKDSNGNVIHAGIPSNASLIFEIKLNGINQ